MLIQYDSIMSISTHSRFSPLKKSLVQMMWQLRHLVSSYGWALISHVTLDKLLEALWTSVLSSVKSKGRLDQIHKQTSS